MDQTGSTAIVLFGATGDLAFRKVLPSLFELELEGEMIAETVIPFTRRNLTTQEFLRDFVRPSLERVFGNLDEEAFERFASRFKYLRGDYDQVEDFSRLAGVLSEMSMRGTVNLLFYMPVHPKQLATITDYMKEAAVASVATASGGWKRVIIEKPFGTSLASAENLFGNLREVFSDSEIYNIDHYLAKPFLRNMVTLRKQETVSSMFGAGDVVRIEARLFEEMGVEERGAFYDAVGAFIDVGQNHVMQMLAAAIILAEDLDIDKDPSQARERALENIGVLTPEEVATNTVRAQYEGYREIERVTPDSETETFFSIKTSIHKGALAGAQVLLEGGKRVGEENLKEVEVVFGDRDASDGIDMNERVIFRLEPREEIELVQRGVEGVERVIIPFRSREGVRQYTEEYKTLFGAAERGDRSIFLSPRETILLWRFAESVVEGWRHNKAPLKTYKKNTRPKF